MAVERRARSNADQLSPRGSSLGWVDVGTYGAGVAVLLALHLMIVRSGGRFLYEERLSIWQALDPQSLHEEFWASLASLHMQPPLMNAIYGLTDGPAADTRLTWLSLGCAVITVLLVVQVLRQCNVSRWWAALAGVAYALLPATVLYALFPYSTTVSALLGMVVLWGLALTRRWAAVGTAISAIGAVGLFLARASFAWPLALGWLALLAVVLLRRRTREPAKASGTLLWGLVAIGVSALVVVGVQAHALVAFGSPSLSTWSAQTAFRGINESGLSPEAKAQLAAADPCFAELMAVGSFQPASAYPVCLPQGTTLLSGTQALDVPEKRSPAQGINFNAGSYAELAGRWAALERAALLREPSAVVRMVVGHDDREGSLSVFLGRSDRYYDTLDLMKTGPTWVWDVLGAWSGVFPWLAWIAVLLAAIGSVIRRVRRRLPLEFWAGSALLLAHALVSVVGNYGENQRFRAEMDPVLLCVAVLGVVALLSLGRRTQASPTIAT